MSHQYTSPLLRFSLPFMAAAICACTVHAQAPSFEKAIPASSFSIEPVIRSAQLAQGEGSFLLATNAMIGTLGDADMLLRKMNGHGDVLHSIEIGDIGGQGYHDVGMEVVQLGASYFVCGYTRAIDTAATPTFTSFLIKLDTALNFQWQKNYILPGPMELYANAMTITDNGQFLIAGQTYDGSEFHTMLMKVTADGSVIWLKQYAIDHGERVHCVRELPGGDILLSGNVVFGFELVLPFAFKVDPDGDLVWGKYYNYPPMFPQEYSNFLFIHGESVDDILLCGHTDVLGLGGEDFYVVDIDSSGALNWARTYGSFQGEFPTAAAFDAAANELVMLGNSSSYSFSFTPTPVAMRIAPDGLLIDARLYGDTTTDQLGSLMATQRVNTDSRALMGWRSFPADDIYIAGTDNDLDNSCHAYPIGPVPLAQLTTTGPFTAIITQPAFLENDLALSTATFPGDTVLCDTPTGIPEPTVTGANAITVLPNPSSGDMHLVSDALIRSGDSIELLDLHGRILRTLHGNGTREVVIARGELGAGMYVVRLMRDGGQLEATRVVVE